MSIKSSVVRCLSTQLTHNVVTALYNVVKTSDNVVTTLSQCCVSDAVNANKS